MFTSLSSAKILEYLIHLVGYRHDSFYEQLTENVVELFYKAIYVASKIAAIIQYSLRYFICASQKLIHVVLA